MWNLGIQRRLSSLVPVLTTNHNSANILKYHFKKAVMYKNCALFGFSSAAGKYKAKLISWIPMKY